MFYTYSVTFDFEVFFFKASINDSDILVWDMFMYTVYVGLISNLVEQGCSVGWHMFHAYSVTFDFVLFF